MTDTSDAVIGVIPGLLAVGIMANVAGKIMQPVKAVKQKASKAKSSSKDSYW